MPADKCVNGPKCQREKEPTAKFLKCLFSNKKTGIPTVSYQQTRDTYPARTAASILWDMKAARVSIGPHLNTRRFQS